MNVKKVNIKMDTKQIIKTLDMIVTQRDEVKRTLDAIQHYTDCEINLDVTLKSSYNGREYTDNCFIMDKKLFIKTLELQLQQYNEAYEREIQNLINY